MESDYVRESVGSALALGLAQVALVRPPDPVEYLGLWLLKHKRNLAESEEMKKAILTTSNKEQEKKEDVTVQPDSKEVVTKEEEDVLPPQTVTVSSTGSRHSSRPSSRLSRIEEETPNTDPPNDT